jgi:lipopolysaccharide/colanic/teichoic acid biosynthesis glycosyltransferase
MSNKRLLDLAGSLLGLISFAPIAGAVAGAILIGMGRPVIFVQERAGQEGKPFKLYKFRTMTELSDAAGRRLPDEERLSHFGGFLRNASLDELPQLWNVLRGDMSLVGPRPLLLEYVPLYNDQQRRRLEVKPGLTGWAQINGRNAITWEQKFAYDVWYVDHRSFGLDLKILAITVARVLSGRGIQKAGQATVPRFTGR